MNPGADYVQPLVSRLWRLNKELDRTPHTDQSNCVCLIGARRRSAPGLTLNTMKKYLDSNKYIDWNHPNIIQKAQELSESCSTENEIVGSCFIFVRDRIKHSSDFKMNPITVKASEVLKYETGFCYSKSHLLAALLRANSIPTGLCYQRLTIEDDKPPYCLHGLNAVFIEKYGWYRIDPRGNKIGVNAEFCPPQEQLAFQMVTKGESDIQGIWPEPLNVVVDVLEKYKTYIEVANNLPDIEIITG